MCSVDTIDVRVQGRPRFARIAGCGTFIIFAARLYHEEKGINRTGHAYVPTQRSLGGAIGTIYRLSTPVCRKKS